MRELDGVGVTDDDAVAEAASTLTVTSAAPSFASPAPVVMVLASRVAAYEVTAVPTGIVNVYVHEKVVLSGKAGDGGASDAPDRSADAGEKVKKSATVPVDAVPHAALSLVARAIS